DVHFSAAVRLWALQRVPWPVMTLAETPWWLVGLSGAAYTLIVARRMRAQTTYRPEFKDWLLHLLLPLTAYSLLVPSALAAPSWTREEARSHRIGRKLAGLGTGFPLQCRGDR